MKKKVFAVVLAMSMMVAMFSGCGVLELAENSLRESYEVSTETISGMEEVSETETVTETEIVVEDQADVEVNTTDTEWSTAYDTYFDEHQMIPDNSQLTATMIQDGVTVKVTAAASGEKYRMFMDFGVASMDFYTIGEKIYCNTTIAGDTQWMVVPVQSEEDVDSIKDMNSANLQNENIISYTYYGEVEMDGVIYDVLDMVVDSDGENQDAYCYINRETQEIYKYIMDIEEESYDMFMEKIDGIELPAEAADAKEGTMDDITGNLLAVVFLAAASSMEFEQ